jgi:hypothetical protein
MDSHSGTLSRTEGIPFKLEVYHLNDATIMIGHRRRSLPNVARPLRLALPRFTRRTTAALPLRFSAAQAISRRSLLAPARCALHPRLLLLAPATPPIGQPLDWPRWLRVLRLCVGPAVPRYAWASLDGRRRSRSRPLAAIFLLHRDRIAGSRCGVLCLLGFC